MAYLVKDGLNPTTVASITSALDARWNAVAITSSGTDTAISTVGLDGGVYHVYSADVSGNLSLASNNEITVDASAPTVSGIAISGHINNGHAGTDLVVGDQILATLTMSEAVTVTGTPYYQILMGSETRDAAYVSGTGTAEDPLVFSYTIVLGDKDILGGITASANALFVDSSHYITDIAGNIMANASSVAIASEANAVRVDTAAPTLSETSISTFTAGVNNLDVTSDIVLKFDSAVTAVTGGHMSLINELNGGAKLGYLGESAQNSINLYFGASNSVGNITTVQAYSSATVQDATTLSGTISINDLTGAVTINPSQDLDLSNNYHIVIDAGAFAKTSSGLLNATMGADSSMHFSTVTAGSATTSGDISGAAGSALWNADGTVLANGGHDWVSIEGIGSPSSLVSIDASTLKIGTLSPNYMFLVQNVSTATNETSFAQLTGISFSNFILGKDALYVDYQNHSLPLPTDTGNALGYVLTSGEGNGATYQVAQSSNLEGILSKLEFLGLSQTQANQAVLFG